MRSLDACPAPALLLSFDFDGTLHDPAESPPVPSAFFETIRALRQTRNAVWGINTGRSMHQVIEGLVESSFPFIPDWVIAREREIFFPNSLGRFIPDQEWNANCEKEISRLFKQARTILAHVRHEIGEHTGAQWIEMAGEPAGIISRSEEEMEWIVAHITPLTMEIPALGWQRNSIYLRFGHRDFQKGSALTEVARLFDLDTARTFAMGDSHNDLEMLSTNHSGIAACPANAVPAVKHLITSRNGLITSKAVGNGVVEALTTLFP
ncbi:MAG: HAD family phosphatase [Armatimonadetes bacterium]|nr:HAD family phosphatase [Akkermansiaceae bacterium]